MKISDDAKLIAAMVHLVNQHGLRDREMAWEQVDALIAAAPAGDAAQTAEPTEEEWYQARRKVADLVSAEAHRLAALRGKA